jgi:hypothetical protein
MVNLGEKKEDAHLFGLFFFLISSVLNMETPGNMEKMTDINNIIIYKRNRNDVWSVMFFSSISCSPVFRDDRD